MTSAGNVIGEVELFFPIVKDDGERSNRVTIVGLYQATYSSQYSHGCWGSDLKDDTNFGSVSFSGTVSKNPET